MTIPIKAKTISRKVLRKAVAKPKKPISPELKKRFKKKEILDNLEKRIEKNLARI